MNAHQNQIHDKRESKACEPREVIDFTEKVGDSRQVGWGFGIARQRHFSNRRQETGQAYGNAKRSATMADQLNPPEYQYGPFLLYKPA